MAWAAFQVKTLYNSSPQYLKLKEILMDSFNFKEEEMYFPGNLEKDNPLGSYVFVQVPKMEDFSAIWPKLIETKFVSAFDGYMQIPDDQMQPMFDSSVEEEKLEDVNIYDIVKVNSGPYSKMFGIVLDKKHKDSLEVWFKLFAGIQFKEIPRNHVERTGSLFDVWKFPVL